MLNVATFYVIQIDNNAFTDIFQQIPLPQA